MNFLSCFNEIVLAFWKVEYFSFGNLTSDDMILLVLPFSINTFTKTSRK